MGNALEYDSSQNHFINHHQANLTRPGTLSAAFSDHASLEMSHEELMEMDEEISHQVEAFLEQFERAEYSLGHALDNPNAIDRAFLSNSENVISIFDHHNFQYSLKETAQEQESAVQSGKTVDENQVTGLGRLKIGIQDQAHEVRNRKRSEDSARFAQFIYSQQQYLLELEERIENLRIEIEDLNLEIQSLQEAQDALEEGDINENSSAGAARRRKVDTALSKQGLSLEDFKKEDGSYDQDALTEALKKQEINAIQERELKTQELRELDQEFSELKSQIKDTPLDHGNESDLAAQYGEMSIISQMSDSALQQSPSFNDSYASAFDTSDWSKEWRPPTAANLDMDKDFQFSPTPSQSAHFNRVAHNDSGGMQGAHAEQGAFLPDLSKQYGSFSANDDERNIISSAFTAAAQGKPQTQFTLSPPDIADELNNSAQNTNTFSQNMNTPGMMA